MNIKSLAVLLALLFFSMAAEAEVRCWPISYDTSPAIQRALRSTVTIVTEQSFQNPLNSEIVVVSSNVGSGVVLDEQLNIVGSGHIAKTYDLEILDDVTKTPIGFVTREEAPKTFHVVTSDCLIFPLTLVSYGDVDAGQLDVAHWRITDVPLSLPAMPRADKRIQPDDVIITLGSPAGNTNIDFEGEVLWYEDGQSRVAINANVSEGMSGGGAVDQYGHIVGINQGYIKVIGSIFYVIHFDLALKFLDLL